MTDSRYSPAFLWRVEQACCNAYPAWREMVVDDWLARAAGGRTRRINSVNALRPDAPAPEALLDTLKPAYARLGQPVMFRVLSLMADVESSLDRLGFVAEGETLTLLAVPKAAETGAVVGTCARPDEGWLDAWAACRPDATPGTVASMRGAVSGLMVPAMFFIRHDAGEVAAVAYAALHRGIAILEAVVTHPAHRQRGHARAVVAAASDWADRMGAEAFCLQVAADNVSARALYRAQGFETELYRYHYRIEPDR